MREESGMNLELSDNSEDEGYFLKKTPNNSGRVLFSDKEGQEPGWIFFMETTKKYLGLD